jgi:DNA repair photolyase
VTVVLTTLDRDLQRTIEPLAAPPQLRLRQIERLQQVGIPVQVALDPLLPGLTDTRANLEPVLHALAHLGVRQITAGYAFLRSGIADNLARALRPHGWDEMVLGAYAGGPLLSAEGAARARYLPKARRQRGYAALMALAAGLGLTVRISGLSNPDFAGPRRPSDSGQRRLLSLGLLAEQTCR